MNIKIDDMLNNLEIERSVAEHNLNKSHRNTLKLGLLDLNNTIGNYSLQKPHSFPNPSPVYEKELLGLNIPSEIPNHKFGHHNTLDLKQINKENRIYPFDVSTESRPHKHEKSTTAGISSRFFGIPAFDLKLKTYEGKAYEGKTDEQIMIENWRKDARVKAFVTGTSAPTPPAASTTPKATTAAETANLPDSPRDSTTSSGDSTPSDLPPLELSTPPTSATHKNIDIGKVSDVLNRAESDRRSISKLVVQRSINKAIRNSKARQSESKVDFSDENPFSSLKSQPKTLRTPLKKLSHVSDTDKTDDNIDDEIINSIIDEVLHEESTTIVQDSAKAYMMIDEILSLKPNKIKLPDRLRVFQHVDSIHKFSDTQKEIITNLMKTKTSIISGEILKQLNNNFPELHFVEKVNERADTVFRRFMVYFQKLLKENSKSSYTTDIEEEEEEKGFKTPKKETRARGAPPTYAKDSIIRSAVPVSTSKKGKKGK